uniref:SRA stem-loop interacting RNA binding protein n=1 Tax=Takifugu rubripes TaxID=31033 RepID=A0A3B5K4B2_TAKRU
MAAPSKKVFEVFVSKVPWTVADELREYFGQFGSVKKCLLPFDKETGFHKGFCWVGFTSEEGLNNALQKEPHLLEGSKVKPLDLTQLALIFPLYSTIYALYIPGHFESSHSWTLVDTNDYLFSVAGTKEPTSFCRTEDQQSL